MEITVQKMFSSHSESPANAEVYAHPISHSYLSIYSFIIMSVLTIYALVAILYNYATIRASRAINDQLVDSILSSTLR